MMKTRVYKLVYSCELPYVDIIKPELRGKIIERSILTEDKSVLNQLMLKWNKNRDYNYFCTPEQSFQNLSSKGEKYEETEMGEIVYQTVDNFYNCAGV